MKGGTTNKIKKHEIIQFIACNVRGINTLGKRQELARQWENDKVDVIIISETQKNTGGMEKGGPWCKYECFISSGIRPKLRDDQEKKREKHAAQIRQNRRKKKGTKPAQMAKPKPKA